MGSQRTAAILHYYYYSGGGAPASSLLDGLIHVWHLDEEGTTTSDLRLDSVGGIHLTPSATLMTQAAGKDGLAFTNDGESRYLFADSQEMRDIVDGSFTFSVWFKLNVLTDMQAILACWNAFGVSQRSYLLVFSPTIGLRWILSAGGDIATGQSDIEVNTSGIWYHAIFGWDSVDKECFLILNGGTPVVVPVESIHKTNQFFSIGAYSSSAAPVDSIINGQVDEVYCWNRVLTADERTELYNAGAGKFYPFSN